MMAEAPSETRFCSQCGRSWPADEFARFGDVLVCRACKDDYAQRLREGAASAGTMRYAGFWVRAGATIIDGIILFVIQFVVGLMFSPVLQRDTGPEQLIMSLMVSLFQLIFGATYEAVLVARYAATPGKMAVGIQVLRPDGSPVSLGRAYGRYFAKMLSGIILGIGFLMAGFDAQKRALHDMICDTRVTHPR